MDTVHRIQAQRLLIFRKAPSEVHIHTVLFGEIVSIHVAQLSLNVFNRYSIGFPKSICLDAIGRITHDSRKEFNGFRST